MKWRLGIVIVIATVGLLAPWIAPHPASGLYENETLRPPSSVYLMGTDELGRDLFSRVLYGTRVSVAVGLTGAGITLLLGGIVGIMAALGGPRKSEWTLRSVDLFISVPEILLVILLAQIIGNTVWGMAFAIGLISWPKVARLIYGEAHRITHELYWESARVTGVGIYRLVMVHLLPNLRSTAIVVFALLVASIILMESALSFIGLGINDPFNPWGTSWGTLAAAGWRAIRGYPHLFFFPAAAVALTVWAANSLSEEFRHYYDRIEHR